MKYLSAVITLAFLFSGCESGYSDRNAGIEGTGSKIDHAAAAYGTVSGFGSIYVNGVHFDTTGAEIEIAGMPAREEDLAVGMIVEVIGQFDPNTLEGSTLSIHGKRAMFGRITQVNDLGWGRKSLQMLGQTVYVNEDASFKGIEFNELRADQGLSISGFVSDSGLITASYVESTSIQEQDLLEIEGYVESFNAASEDLQIKDLNVNVSNAIFNNGNFENLTVGARIHIKGRLLNEANQLVAEQITFVPSISSKNSHISIEGVVRELNSDTTLTIRDTVVNFSNAQIKIGSIEDLQQHAQITAIGRQQQNVLTADYLYIKSFDTRRFSGTVQDVDAHKNSFNLNNTRFKITELTQYQDNSAAQNRYFNFSDLRVGEELEVFSVRAEGAWKATKIVRHDADINRPFWISGEARLIENSTNFMVNDILVDGSELSNFEWQALRDHDEPVRVNVEGYFTGESQFRATHVFIFPEHQCDPRFFYCDFDKTRTHFEKFHFKKK